MRTELAKLGRFQREAAAGIENKRIRNEWGDLRRRAEANPIPDYSVARAKLSLLMSTDCSRSPIERADI